MPDLEIELEWEGLDEAFAELEQDCTDIVRGMTVWAWNNILQQTPQWSGALVVSWSYSLNAPHYVDRSEDLPPAEGGNEGFDEDGQFFINDFMGHHKGYSPNIAFANTFNAGNDLRFKLGDTVYISNGRESEDDYAEAIEGQDYGVVRLRSVNMPGRMAGRTLDRMHSMWDANGVSNIAAQNLKLLRVGNKD